MKERKSSINEAVAESLVLQASGSWRSLKNLRIDSGNSHQSMENAFLNALCTSALLGQRKPEAIHMALEQLDSHTACMLKMSHNLFSRAQEHLLLDQREKGAAMLRQAIASSLSAATFAGIGIPSYLTNQLLGHVTQLEHTLKSQLDLSIAIHSGDFPSQLILVLGMHRCGTSALSGLLIEAGLDGPNDPMPASPTNPKGFWESQELVALNDQLLKRLGSHWSTSWSLTLKNWDNNPFATRTWLPSLLNLLRTRYQAGGHAVIKDPRLCVLLPALRPWIESNVIPCIAFLPIRHPAEAVESLNLAQGIPHRQGLLLWLSHVLIAEQQTRQIPRLIVCHNQLLSDPQSVSTQIYSLLEKKSNSLSIRPKEDASKFIDPQLYRQQAKSIMQPWAQNNNTEYLHNLATRIYNSMTENELGEQERSHRMDHFMQHWAALAP